MKSYLLRLICAAFVCAMVDAIADGPGKKTRHMVAGMFLMLTALSLPKQPELPDFRFERILSDAQTAAAVGITRSVDAQTDIITEAYAAYILNEANALGICPEICVMLEDDLTPARIILSGSASPGLRQALAEAVAEGLGLGEEDVIWNDFHQSSA